MGKLTRKTLNVIVKKLFVTIGIVSLVRIGTFFPVPGIDLSALDLYLRVDFNTRNLINTFSGSKTFVIGLFTLNIFPYINATIISQFLVKFLPDLARLQKENDLKNRRLIQRLTRLITLIVALIQSTALALYLKNALPYWSINLAVDVILWLTTGAMIVLWLSELITEYGLGNGSSILIYVNIVSNLPNLSKKILFENNENLPLLSKIAILLLLFLSLYGIVFLQEGLRLLPLVSSKQLNQGRKSRRGKSYNYLPLRYNQAGVMPIILTTAVLVVPSYLSQFGFLATIPEFFSWKGFGFLYWIIYFALILFFSASYSNLLFNPKDVSDQLSKMSVVIQGRRPGLETTLYLKKVINRISLIGAILLAILVILPNFLISILSQNSLNGLGTTSLLILAGTLLDLGREISSIINSERYDRKY